MFELLLKATHCSKQVTLVRMLSTYLVLYCTVLYCAEGRNVQTLCTTNGEVLSCRNRSYRNDIVECRQVQCGDDKRSKTWAGREIKKIFIQH